MLVVGFVVVVVVVVVMVAVKVVVDSKEVPLPKR